MLATIKHQDTGQLVVVAKQLTGYIKESKKITDAKGYIEANGIFDANFTAFIVSWQTNHRLTADGIIGPATWESIAKAAPTCSTSKNRTSGYTFALQLLLGDNVTPDGIYGSRTKAAVAALQSASGLSSDGVCGPKTWNQIIIGDAKPEPVPTPCEFVQPVNYLQGKPEPWAGYMYSNHNDKSQTMANSGCGPTAAADVMATLIDKNITPWTLAQLAMEWGDRTYNSGTAWSFFKHLADYYHFTKFIQSGNFDVLKACSKAGGYVVCSMGPGYWTSSGHFICAWKFTDTDVYCNDPASRKRTHQSISQFKKECKQYFAFYPNEPEDKNEEPITNANKAPLKRGKKIVDISKHQPNVNYDALIEDTALIILRAGYRGTSGKVKIDECFIKHATALKARGVRFGTYFYSIANTVSKAREEAQAYIEYAMEYNPLFWSVDLERPEITNNAIGAFADEMRNLGIIDKFGAYVANEKYISPYHFDKVRDDFDFVWIPNYLEKPKFKCDMWQYSSTERVNGINANVDMNRITGDGHPLEWFLGEPEPGTEPVSSDSEPVSGENPTPPTTAFVLVTGGNVNLRNAPGLDGYVYAIVHSGDRFDYGGETKNVSGTAWYKIILPGYSGCWISSKYSRLVE